MAVGTTLTIQPIATIAGNSAPVSVTITLSTTSVTDAKNFIKNAIVNGGGVYTDDGTFFPTSAILRITPPTISLS